MRYNIPIHPVRGEAETGGATILEGVLLIPGRVYSKLRTPEFERWRAHAVSSVALQIASVPLVPHEPLEVHLDLYYPYNGSGTPDDLAEKHIPRVTAAAESVLIALSGVLYRRRNQVQQLTLNRITQPAEQLALEYGDVWRNGGVRIRYAVRQNHANV